MATIFIQRKHSLAPNELRRHVDALAEDLQRKLSAKYHWEGDTLHFSRTGASGTITLDPERLEIQVELGLLLRPFTNAVEQSVNEYLDEYLA